MSFMVRAVKVPPNSASLSEAKARVFEFFKTACRSIPTIMEIYNLDDVVTKSQLRSSIASQIRKNAHITNPKGYSRTRELDSEELLEQLPALQQLLYHLVGCRPEGSAVANYVIQYALALV